MNECLVHSEPKQKNFFSIRIPKNGSKFNSWQAISSFRLFGGKKYSLTTSELANHCALFTCVASKNKPYSKNRVLLNQDKWPTGKKENITREPTRRGHSENEQKAWGVWKTQPSDRRAKPLQASITFAIQLKTVWFFIPLNSKQDSDLQLAQHHHQAQVRHYPQEIPTKVKKTDRQRLHVATGIAQFL